MKHLYKFVALFFLFLFAFFLRTKHSIRVDHFDNRIKLTGFYFSDHVSSGWKLYDQYVAWLQQ